MAVAFEHVGMTVSDLDRALDFYIGLLGLRLVVRRVSPKGDGVAFVDCGGAMLEMIAPAGGAGRSEDVAPGRSGLRHLTFRFDDIGGVWARLEAAGVEMVEKPRAAFNSDVLARVAFCRDPDGIMIELAEIAPGRAG